MIYLNLFDIHNGYEDFSSGGTMQRPNVSACIQERHVHYDPRPVKVKGKITIPNRILEGIMEINSRPSSGGDSGGGK